jgi:hypothetical protein
MNMTEQAKCAECSRDMDVTEKMEELRQRVRAVEGPKADVGFICVKCETAILMGGPIDMTFN